MGGLAVRRKQKLKFVNKCLHGPHNRSHNATRHFALWKGQKQLRNKACSLFPYTPAKSDDEVYQKGGDAWWRLLSTSCS